MMKEELNLFKLIQQIRKLKAGVCALIKNDSEILADAEERYIKYSTIDIKEIIDND